METIQHFVETLAEQYASRTAIVHRTEFRRKAYSYVDIYLYSHRIATFFEQQGWRKGDKVIIYAPNSPEWCALLIACAISGVIAVPMDFGSNTDFPKAIARKVKAKAAFTSQLKPLGEKSLKEFFIEELAEMVKDKEPHKPKETLVPDDIVEIVYTSGTTSEPKGVIITHRNIVANIASFRSVMPVERHKFLSVIPLSHMLEQTIGCFIPLRHGCTICYTYSRKPAVILEAMRDENISAIVTVPLFLKTFKERIEHEAEKRKKLPRLQGMQRRLLNAPVALRRLAFRRITKAFGRLQYFVCGGAPLPLDVEEFWDSLGIIVLQGYGLTETAPIISCNTPRAKRRGTVGKVLPNQQIRIVDGEIQTRGDNVTQGYYENKAADAAAFKDGWYLTGDLGEIDKDGFLTIKGRKKNMIVTSSGMKVYPEDIEQVINAQPGVKDSCVLGVQEKDVIITAVVIGEFDERALMDAVNGRLSSHQRLQRVVKWNEDFPRTPSMKVKRGELEAKLKGEHVQAHQQNKLYELLARLANGQLRPDARLTSDLAIDSLHRVELLARIEEEFGVELQEEQITPATTVKDLEQMVATAAPVQRLSLHLLNTAKGITPIRTLLQYVSFALIMPFTPLTVKGSEHLRLDGPAIFVINHASHLDTPVTLRALPYSIRKRVAFAAAEDYFFANQSPLGKLKSSFLRILLNIYPFSREGNIRHSLRLTGKLIDCGCSIAIYPEGTRTTTGKMAHFKTGIGFLAAHMEVPIVPVRIDGLYEVLPKGRLLPRRRHVTITFGEPYLPASKSYIDLTNEVEAKVRSL